MGPLLIPTTAAGDLVALLGPDADPLRVAVVARPGVAAADVLAALDVAAGTPVEVDGNVVKSYPVTSDDRCVDRGGRDFGYAVPCPLQASSTIAIDPADLPAGNHKVGLYVEDAAGNRTAIMPPTDRPP